MRYRVCSGPRGLDDVSPMSKEKMLYKEFDSLDSALSWAWHVESDPDRK